MNTSHLHTVDQQRPAERPVHLTSDYVEMAYLGAMLAVGLPLNLYVFCTLVQSLTAARHAHQQHQAKNESVRNGFLLMKINLNLCDLLFLCVICVGKLAWLASYEWRAGVVACKLYQFLSMITMYISSNVIVCIALDRLRNVLNASTVRQNVAESVRNMLLVAWSLSILWSLPQLYIWTVADVFPELPGGFYQCSDMWSLAQRFNTTVNQEYGTVYNVMHVLLVFWIPLLVLIVAYLAIATRLLQYSLKPASSVPKGNVAEHNNETPLLQNDTNTPRGSLCMTNTNNCSRTSLHLLPSENANRLCIDNSQHVIASLDQNDSANLVRLSPFSCQRPDQLSRHPVVTPPLEMRTITLVHTANGAGTTLDCRPTVEEDDSGIGSGAGAVTNSAAKPPPPRYQHLFASAPTTRSQRDRASLGNTTTTDVDDDQRRPSAVVSRTGRMAAANRRLSHMPHFATMRLRTDWQHGVGGLLHRRAATRPAVPAWRRQLRSRVFRTTMLVVLTHVLFWLPYNVFVISKYISPEFHKNLNSHANIFKDLQILLTLVNPFLYGFGT